LIQALTVVGALAGLAGCSGFDTTPRCLPDEPGPACFCPTGQAGTRVCEQEGTAFGACVCEADGGANDAGVSDAGALEE